MIISNQPTHNVLLYKQMLYTTGKLSRLFSENKAPYLVSRNIENAFCEAFGADNLGRDDSSADASLNNIGIGLKTFLHGNGKTLQKIAEFNRDAHLFRDNSEKQMVRKISKLRNERLKLTMRSHGFNQILYHCVTRKENQILIFETNMDLINEKSIKNVQVRANKNIITFNDGLNYYSFNISKSTLYQRFYMDDPLFTINVDILDNPYKELAEIFKLDNKNVPTTIKGLTGETNKPYVILPLFSDRSSKRQVPQKSGLNQWNAAGRERNPNEIYIPIPSWIHHKFPCFFPKRDFNFDLILPDKEILSAKVCQDNRKALMTNPNKALGKWLLRDVMELSKKELLEYPHLELLGIDSVIIYKHSYKRYEINFCSLGSYDEFISEQNN